MATLFDFGYTRNYYSETSGSWVAPSSCFEALVILAAGGGGGGGGGGAVSSPATAGSNGSAGGNTTFTGPGGISLSSTGGAAGTGGAVGSSGVGGTGGYNSGNVSRARNGSRIQANSGDGGNFISNSQQLNYGLYDSMQLMGGVGGVSSGLAGTFRLPFGSVAEPGIGVNAGAAGNTGASNVASPSTVANAGGGGGHGGAALGEKYLCKITPGATYTITIGSGGAGGAGGNAGPNGSTSNYGGGGGGGGASGFVSINWNENPQGT